MKFFRASALVGAMVASGLVPAMAQTAASRGGGVQVPLMPIQGSFADGVSGVPRLNALSLFARSLAERQASNIISVPSAPAVEQALEPEQVPTVPLPTAEAVPSLPAAIEERPAPVVEAPVKKPSADTQPAAPAAKPTASASQPSMVRRDGPMNRSVSGESSGSAVMWSLSMPSAAPTSSKPAAPVALPNPFANLLPVALTNLPAVGQTNQALGCVGTSGTGGTTGCATLQAGGGFGALAIPEPGVVLLLGSGLLAMGMRRRQR